MIYYRHYWSSEKNFGKAINDELIAFDDSLKPDDWIVLLDGDCMFLTPYWGKQIEDIIAANEKYYAVLGGMLSRCNVPHQLLDSKISDNFNVLFHREIALDRHDRFYTDVKETRGPIAAACMMFKMEWLWKVSGFEENTVHFDSIFSQDVIKAGGKLGICQGLYLFHLYRPDAVNPGHEYKHLIP